MPDTTAASLIVLDTNVALDVFLFERDALLDPLRQAVREGRVIPIATPWAAAEFQQILRLDKIPGTAERRQLAWESFEHVTQLRELPPKQRPTPKCADRMDQDFIDLVVATDAAWLLSRDKKVLRLRKRFEKLELPTRVMHPLDWCASFSC